MTDYIDVPWRTGRREGLDMYAQLGPEPSDSDPPIGTLDTGEIAAEACQSHNAALAQRKAGRGATFSGVSGLQVGDGGIQNNNYGR